MRMITGKVRKHPRGYGFLIADASEQTDLKIFISEDELRQVLQGDRVKVQLIPGRRDLGPRARIVEILSHGQTHCIGTLKRIKDHHWVMRSEEDPDPDLLLKKSPPSHFREGDLVLAKIINYPDARTPPIGECIEVLDAKSATMDLVRCAILSGWPMEFREDSESQAQHLSVLHTIPSWRTDCRNIPFVTIDGEDAKDFDDAVAAVPSDDGQTIKVYVAIADVSHYVQTDSSIDQDAFERATSVYFPGAVWPMLPEKLSNELCSLMPKVERDAMICEMIYTKTGEQKRYRFYPGRIISQRRCTYGEVEHFRQSGELKEASENVLASLRTLYVLYHHLREQRRTRGALDFDLPETRIYVDSKGFPTQILREVRYESHKLIEEWMIAANVCAADFILEKHGQGVFRNHATPESKKLALFMAMMKAHFPQLNANITSIQQTPKAMQTLLDKIERSEKKEQVHALALRSMPVAVYESTLKRHYGLGLSHYTHFTSPIRRYPDLMVHRLIKAALTFMPQSERHPITPDECSLDEANQHCSERERAAMELEWKVKDIKKARYMQPFVGEAFVATITGVTRAGLFVRLQDIAVDGLIPMETLPRDQYMYDELHQSLKGKNPRHRFQLGDTLSVMCTQVQIENGRISFELIYDSSR